MRKKTIHFNDETLKEIDELISLLEIKGYGDIPKAIKFSVTFTLQELKRQVKVLPNLNESDLELWNTTIKNISKKSKREDLAEKVLKGVEK